MRRAHTVEQVRAAEAELMARLPEGTLMQRAATGLAVAISNFLGSTYGARVVLLIGSGDNGGDALYAGARLARRGAQVTAVLLSDKAHADGLDGAAGSRRTRRLDRRHPRRPTWWSTASSASAAAPVSAPTLSPPSSWPTSTAYRSSPSTRPSGVDVDTGETPEPHVRAALTVTFGTHKICHFIDPAATACGPVHLVEIGLDLPPAAVESLQAADVRALYPVPHGESDKYSRGVLGLMVGSSAVPRRRRHRHGRRPRRPGRHGPVRRPGRRRSRSPGRPPGDRGRRRPRAGLGRRAPAWATTSTSPRIRELLDAEEPVVLDADGLKALDDSGDHADVLATPARGRAGPPARCRPRHRRSRAPRARPAGRRTLRRDRPAQGLDHGHRPPRRARPRQHQRHPLAGHRRRRRRPGRPLRRPARVPASPPSTRRPSAPTCTPPRPTWRRSAPRSRPCRLRPRCRKPRGYPVAARGERCGRSAIGLRSASASTAFGVCT